jgi:hypothetical protein
MLSLSEMQSKYLLLYDVTITDPSADRLESLLTCAYAVRCSLP